MSTRAAQVLLENYNADIEAAIKDGLEVAELLGLMGSIVQCGLHAIEPSGRRTAWDTMVKIMNRRFEEGAL